MIKKILNLQRNMSSNKMKVKSNRRRYYLKNRWRFITLLIVILMCIASLYLLTEILNPAEAISSIPEKTPVFAQSNTNNENTGNIKSNPIVVIDPGHGGRDPGAISPY